ncbi:MAG: flagellar hook-basal body complex protein FliE [Stellaceae bacterium]
MIEALSAIATTLADLQSIASDITAPSAASAGGVPNVAGGSGMSFSAALQGALDRLDGTVASANGAAKSFAAGNHDIPLSDVMVSLEQANLGMQMAANVRDKIVAAYSNVMNMQI